MKTPIANPPATQRPMARPAVMLAVLTLALVAWQSRLAVIVWAYDGLIAAGILAVCGLAGVPLLRLFRLNDLPARWRFLFACGLGLGLASLLVLGCGLSGAIVAQRRWIAPGLLALFAIGGAVDLARYPSAGEPSAAPGDDGSWRWWLPALAPFAALLLLVATCPPGVLWEEEGNGYDVLEYHLQLPREYYEAGRIAYLPHNVYANFPSAAEMLYLLAMQVTGQTIEAWGVAQCLNAQLAVLLVVAAWAAGRDRGSACGIVAALAAGSGGWLVYLSGLAYVENGMLFCGFLAAVSAARGVESGCLRLVALGGVFAGLACGFKYPAVGLIAAPIAIGLLAAPSPWRTRLRAVGVFSIAALLAFAPWLAKNAVMTGNPVFPLLSEHFDEQPEGWGAAEARHFAESHRPGPDESGAIHRISLLARHVLLERDQRFGILLLVLAAIGAWRRSDPRRYWLIVLGVQIVVWLVATHLYARFAVPLLIPLFVLAAGAVRADHPPARPIAAILALGLLTNVFFAGRLYARHVYAEDGQRLPFEAASGLFTEGLLEPYAYLGTINRDLPADAHVLLVGDARPFYIQRRVSYSVVFNRQPLAELVEQGRSPAEILDELHRRSITHVLVHWGEIERLRRSRYGFPPSIDRALFAELEAAGLRRLQAFGHDPDRSPSVVLYEVGAPQ